MKHFFTDWKWGAFIGFVNIFGFIGFNMNNAFGLGPHDITQYILLLCAIYFFLKALFLKSFDARGKAGDVLKDIAISHAEQDFSWFGFGEHDKCGAIPVNELWLEWINQLLKVTKRTDLDYYNFGDHYYLYDLLTGDIMDFPTGVTVKTSRIGNIVPHGRVLRVMQK